MAAPGVLGNDTDADGNPLTAVLNANVTHGTLTLNADGSFSYTPNATYLGSDSFTYHANDGAANSNIVTVSLTVAPDTYYVDNTVTCSDSGAGTLAQPYLHHHQGSQQGHDRRPDGPGPARHVCRGREAELRHGWQPDHRSPLRPASR